MRPSRWVPARCTRCNGSCAFSVPKRGAWLTIMSVKPMMALSGVRSSWLMLATNCDLYSLACWSCWFLLLDFVEQSYILDGDHRLIRHLRAPPPAQTPANGINKGTASAVPKREQCSRLAVKHDEVLMSPDDAVAESGAMPAMRSR